MCRKGNWTFVVFIIVFLGAQLVRPSRANPPIDPARTIGAQGRATSSVAAVLDRSCRDCHSNATVWPRYTQVAPLSWLMASAVAKGRSAVNFSEWAGYSPEAQQVLLKASCDDASSGKMPGVYALLRPETRLSPRDIETICGAAQQLGAQALAGGAK